MGFNLARDMKTHLSAVLLGILLSALSSCAQTPPVRREPVKLIQEWSGSVADESLITNASPVIVSDLKLKQLWQAWSLTNAIPTVDFTRQLVVVTTSRGSRLRLMPSLDEHGDLHLVGLGTRDLRPGFRYVIATISRDGVKTANGLALPRE
jgi:hypothetical protein